MRQPIYLKVPILSAALLLGLPHSATAQTVSAPTPVSLKLPPGITVSGGAGVMSVQNADQKSVPVFGGSMEIALNRFMLAQVEVASGRSDYHDTYEGYFFTTNGVTGYSGDFVSSGQRRQTDLVGNFLGRAGKGRVHALFGAGFGMTFMASKNTSTRVGCIPAPLSPCPTSDFYNTGSYVDFVQQFVAGVDVQVTKRLTAYATLRGRTMPVDLQQTAMLVGLRATVRRAPLGMPFSSADRARNADPAAAARLVTPAAATGREVHVVAMDHSRQTGHLVSIDDTHVTISGRDGQVSIPQNDVQGMRLVSHVFRDSTVVGLGVGLGTGLLWGLAVGEDGGGYALEGALMFGGIGAGAGAAIGAVLNLTGAEKRSVNIGPAKATVNLAPAIGKGRVGFTGLVSW
jgi:hypothetical protein